MENSRFKRFILPFPPPPKNGGALNKQKNNPDKVEEFRICWIYNWAVILKRKRERTCECLENKL